MNNRKFYRPTKLSELIALSSELGHSFRFVAGGTDVVVNHFQGNDNTPVWVDLTGLDELKNVSLVDGGVLRIGPMICLDDLANYELIRNHLPALIESAGAVASPVIRKTATLGGNLLCENRCVFYNQSEWWRDAAGNCLKCGGDICIATGGKKSCFSKFVSDTAPLLISVDAEIEVAENGTLKKIPLESIYTGNGIQPRNLSSSALIQSIRVDVSRNFRSVFRKLRVREAVDFTSLTTAVSVDRNNKLKIAAGGIDPKPVVASGIYPDDIQALSESIVKKARIIDNDVYPRLYRKEMLKLYLRHSFDELKKH